MAHEFDVVVIGSGFGGSVAALRLREKGYSVAVLEAGRRFEDKDFPKTSWRLRKFLFAPALGLYGIQRIHALPDVLILCGAGVGGGSLVYANTLYQPGDKYFDDPQWKSITDWKSELTPFYELARRMLGVEINPYFSPSDQAMKDVTGFTSELGTKGVFMDRKGPITFDINVFYLRYNGKIGTYSVNNAPFKTNIGDVVSKGMEAYVEWSFFNPFFKNSTMSELLSVYVSGTIQDARYVTWNNPALAQDPSLSIQGKKVEYAPSQLLRTGLNYDFKGFSFNYQFSYTGSVFTDAANTVLPNHNATVGQLKAYSLHDISVSYKFNKNYQVKNGANNLFNEIFATRRSGGYPGPGLLPSQGRSIYGTMIIKL